MICRVMNCLLMLYSDVVDTEPSDGNVWKMLLGPIMELFDDDNDDDESGTPAPNQVSPIIAQLR